MESKFKKLKTKAFEEFKVMALLTLYLAILFGALTTYKRLILAQQGIGYADYGVSVIDALILAKVLLIGGAFRVGTRFNDRPLIIPALHKTLCFSFLVLALAVVERLIKGWWAGNSTSAILGAILGPEKWPILARVVMLYVALVPFFAFWEVNRVLGGDVLRKLFFKPRTTPDGSAQN